MLASRGYPAKYEIDLAIEGLQRVASMEDIIVFHAGTKLSNSGEVVTSGGRVLGVTARGETLEKALGRCYSAINQIKWEGMQYRRDIGQFKQLSSPAH